MLHACIFSCHPFSLGLEYKQNFGFDPSNLSENENSLFSSCCTGQSLVKESAIKFKINIASALNRYIYNDKEINIYFKKLKNTCVKSWLSLCKGSCPSMVKIELTELELITFYTLLFLCSFDFVSWVEPDHIVLRTNPSFFVQKKMFCWTQTSQRTYPRSKINVRSKAMRFGNTFGFSSNFVKLYRLSRKWKNE